MQMIPCSRGVRPARLRLPLLAAVLLAAWPAWGQAPAGTIPAFAVEVTLSPRAAAQLQAASEGIVVSASYYGNATRAARRRANPMGQINLAARNVAIPGRGGTARFPAIPVSPALLDGIVNRRPEVLVNVFSARRSGPDNLLDCGIFQDAPEVAAAAPVGIACKLIGEP